MKKFIDKVVRVIKPAFKFLKSFIIKWNEFVTIPLGWFMTRWSEPFITTYYPTSTRYDVGFYYDLIYSLGAVFIIHGFSYILFKINWVIIERYLDVNLEQDFNKLNPFQRIIIALWLFNTYFFGFILTFFALCLS